MKVVSVVLAILFSLAAAVFGFVVGIIGLVFSILYRAAPLLLVAAFCFWLAGCQVNVIVAPGATVSGNDSVRDSSRTAAMIVPADSDVGFTE